MAGKTDDAGIEEPHILMIADDYKMPESEVRVRFSDSEIARIMTLWRARNVRDEILYPKK
jgi:hypothetical protein